MKLTNVLWGLAVLVSVTSVVYGNKTVISKKEYAIIKAEGSVA